VLAGARGGTETVLITEDEAPLRGLLRDVLDQAGYRLLEASDGASALRVADAYPHPIHLLVSDVVMPGMNGVELAAKLVQERPDMRVLLISGYAQGLTANQAQVTVEGAPFLRKPFTPDELLGRIREVLDAG
jgi:DNA-binding response OmpR family regulator